MQCRKNHGIGSLDSSNIYLLFPLQPMTTDMTIATMGFIIKQVHVDVVIIKLWHLNSFIREYVARQALNITITGKGLVLRTFL